MAPLRFLTCHVDQDIQRLRGTALPLDRSACAQCLSHLWRSRTLRGHLDTTGYSCGTWSEEIEDRDPCIGVQGD